MFRTPDTCFASIPGLNPSFHETTDGIRISYTDTGPSDAPAVWFLHGEPTWSYLWRNVIPPIRDAGFRCVAPDLVGFGRSDKPIDPSWYSYDRHVETMTSLLTALQVQDATIVVHDWGGPIGLRMAVEHPQAFTRIVITNSGLFTGRQRMTDAWSAFRDFVEHAEDLPISSLIQGACKRRLTGEEFAAYDAPFPTPSSKAGARAFPLIIPQSPSEIGASQGQAVLNALAADTRPMLMLWGTDDPILPPSVGMRFATALNRPAPQFIPEASHFLQEDQATTVASRILQWLLTTDCR